MDDGKMKPIDLSELLANYENKWVVLSEDGKKVIASGDTVEEIEKSIPKGRVFKVPRFDAAYVPHMTL